MNKNLEKAVRAFKKGDENAFDYIYDQTRVPVYYTILAILHDESLAEDIMQDTYLKMIKELENYQEKRQFTAWIKTIARNLALNEYKKRKHELNVDVSESDALFDKVYPQSEKQYYLRKLLEQLPKDERDIVIRHVLLEEKHKDIAKKLDMPLGTVLWKYSKAIKELKRIGGENDGKIY